MSQDKSKGTKLGSFMSEDKIIKRSSLEDVASNAESTKFVSSRTKRNQRFVPKIDYSNPEEFAKFGSAEAYYTDSIQRIYKTYPYDGSLHEQEEWFISSSFLDLYVFNNLYPKTVGSFDFSSAGWGNLEGSKSGNYGKSDSPEFISVFGGPTTGDIYSEADNRDSSLKFDPIRGNTIELWIKKDDFVPSSKTEREVIFDCYSKNSTSTETKARITLELDTTAATDCLMITYMSGAMNAGTPILKGINQTIEGSDKSKIVDGNWHHLAISLYNTGDDLRYDFYIDGTRESTETIANQSLGTSNRNMIATIGSLAAADAVSSTGELGSGHLSASIDEFRFWKTKRNEKEIGRYYQQEVNGGTDSDHTNSNLGVYFKFNEGVNLKQNIVLDYSGRNKNGIIANYKQSMRNPESGINSAPFTEMNEKPDPIMFPTDQNVENLIQKMKSKGQAHDFENVSLLKNTAPSFMIEEDNEGHLANLMQTISSYFDEANAYISHLPDLKKIRWEDIMNVNTENTSSVECFDGNDVIVTRKLPQYHDPTTVALIAQFSAGKEIFSSAEIIEQFLGRTEGSVRFESSLYDIRDFIVQNIYNNLTHIYKKKGTEQSFRNLIRCFGVDDELIKLNVYSNNGEFKINDDSHYTTYRAKTLSMSHQDNRDITLCQEVSSENPAISKNFIPAPPTPIGEASDIRFGLTAEANIVFPKILSKSHPNYSRLGFTESSLFGFGQSDRTATVAHKSLYVAVVKDSEDSPDARFQLRHPAVSRAILTSELIPDVYSNSTWNISLRVRNPVDHLHGVISGTASKPYEIVLSGYNYSLDELQNSFSVSINDYTFRDEFIQNDKEFFLGARRANVYNGNVETRTDVRFINCTLWQDALDDEELMVHAKNPSNIGRINSFKNIDVHTTSLDDFDIKREDTKILHWDFNNAQESSGEIKIDDISHGSSERIASNGAMGAIVGFDYPALTVGVGNLEKAIKQDFIVITKFSTIENVHASDQIQILDADRENFNTSSRPETFSFSFEKSMSATVTDEIIKYFGSLSEFNNLIGEPVHKYRQGYKGLEKLRAKFFEKVSNDLDYDRFITFFRWIDESLSKFLNQLKPYSSQFSGDMSNVVESHILERNKYHHKFPTLEMKLDDPESPMLGVNELLYDWEHGHAPPGSRGTIYNFEDSIVDQLPAGWTAQNDNPAEGGGAVVRHRDPADTTTNKALVIRGESVHHEQVQDPPHELFNAVTFYRWVALEKVFSGPLTVSFKAYQGRVSGDYGTFDKTEANDELFLQYKVGSGQWQNAGEALVADLSPSGGTWDLSSVVTREINEHNPISLRWIHRTNAASNADDNDLWVIDDIQITTFEDHHCLWWADRAEGNKEFTYANDIGDTREYLRKMQNKQAKGSTYVFRKLSRPYKYSVDNQPIYKGGQYRDSYKIDDYYKLVTQFASVSKIQLLKSDIEPETSCQDVLNPQSKTEITGQTTVTGLSGYYNVDSDLSFPFTMISSSAADMFPSIHSNILVTNNHLDQYGDDYEIPLQSPFTERFVGGMPHRHQDMNRDATEDLSEKRPEAYNLVENANTSITIEARTPSEAASRFYRDGLTKRPVNIANIKFTKDSKFIGNYNKDYEVVMVNGRSINNNDFVDNEGFNLQNLESPHVAGLVEPELPINKTSIVDSNKKMRTRTEHVIVNRFSSPGGPETSLDSVSTDFESSEFSPYNTINYRNLNVRRILDALHAEKSNQFGIRPVTSVSGHEMGSLHKTNRNSFFDPTLPTDGTEWDAANPTGEIDNDSFVIQHPIPQNDVQYSWITTSSDATIKTFRGYTSNFTVPSANGKSTFPDQIEFIGDADNKDKTKKLDFVDSNRVVQDKEIDVTTNIYSYESDSDAKDLNERIITRQGPYGHPSWKQIRGYQNLITRQLRKQNIYSYSFRAGVHSPNAEINSYELTSRNTSSARRRHSRIVKNYKEIPVTTRFKPLLLLDFDDSILRDVVKIYDSSAGTSPQNYEETFWTQTNLDQIPPSGSDLRDRLFFLMKDSYANEITSYSNMAIAAALGIKERQLTSFDSVLDQFSRLENAPPAFFRQMSYVETVYPKESVTFTKETKNRNNFAFRYKKAHKDRQEILTGSNTYEDYTHDTNNPNEVQFNNPGFKKINVNKTNFDKTNSMFVDAIDFHGTANFQHISQSSWLLDSRENFATTMPTCLTMSFVGAKHVDFEAGGRDQGNRYEGELQNDYSIFHMGINKLHGMPPSALVYNRRVPQLFSEANRGPFTGEYLTGEAQWQTAEQANVHPTEDSYEQYSEDIKLIGRGYSLVPEFRISEHIHKIIQENTGRLTKEKFNEPLENIFTLEGATHSQDPEEAYSLSIGGDFYKTYATSDFLKYFSILDDSFREKGISVRPNRLSLRCSAVMKFLPYEGFYPAERTKQIGNIFARNYLSNFSYRQVEGIDISNSLDKKLSGSLGQAIKPLMSPGLLYNSIKSGLAVDYPIFYNLGSSSPASLIMFFNFRDNAPAGKRPWSRTTGLPRGDTVVITSRAKQILDIDSTFFQEDLLGGRVRDGFGGPGQPSRELNANQLVATQTTGRQWAFAEASANLPAGSQNDLRTKVSTKIYANNENVANYWINGSGNGNGPTQANMTQEYFLQQWIREEIDGENEIYAQMRYGTTVYPGFQAKILNSDKTTTTYNFRLMPGQIWEYVNTHDNGFMKREEFGNVKIGADGRPVLDSGGNVQPPDDSDIGYIASVDDQGYYKNVWLPIVDENRSDISFDTTRDSFAHASIMDEFTTCLTTWMYFLISGIDTYNFYKDPQGYNLVERYPVTYLLPSGGTKVVIPEPYTQRQMDFMRSSSTGVQRDLMDICLRIVMLVAGDTANRSVKRLMMPADGEPTGAGAAAAILLILLPLVSMMSSAFSGLLEGHNGNSTDLSNGHLWLLAVSGIYPVIPGGLGLMQGKAGDTAAYKDTDHEQAGFVFGFQQEFLGSAGNTDIVSLTGELSDDVDQNQWGTAGDGFENAEAQTIFFSETDDEYKNATEDPSINLNSIVSFYEGFQNGSGEASSNTELLRRVINPMSSSAELTQFGSLTAGTGITGSFLNNTADNHIPRIKSSVYKRIQFENLLDPKLMFNTVLYDNEPHPSAALFYGNFENFKTFDYPAHFGTINFEHSAGSLGVVDYTQNTDYTPFKLAMNNFAAETVNFFLADRRLTTLESSDVDFVGDGRLLKMRVYVKNKNTVVYDRKSAFGPPVNAGVFEQEVRTQKEQKVGDPGVKATGFVEFLPTMQSPPVINSDMANNPEAEHDNLPRMRLTDPTGAETSIRYYDPENFYNTTQASASLSFGASSSTTSSADTVATAAITSESGLHGFSITDTVFDSSGLATAIGPNNLAIKYYDSNNFVGPTLSHTRSTSTSAAATASFTLSNAGSAVNSSNNTSELHSFIVEDTSGNEMQISYYDPVDYLTDVLVHNETTLGTTGSFTQGTPGTTGSFVAGTPGTTGSFVAGTPGTTGSLGAAGTPVTIRPVPGTAAVPFTSTLTFKDYSTIVSGDADATGGYCVFDTNSSNSFQTVRCTANSSTTGPETSRNSSQGNHFRLGLPGFSIRRPSNSTSASGNISITYYDSSHFQTTTSTSTTTVGGQNATAGFIRLTVDLTDLSSGGAGWQNTINVSGTDIGPILRVPTPGGTKFEIVFFNGKGSFDKSNPPSGYIGHGSLGDFVFANASNPKRMAVDVINGSSFASNSILAQRIVIALNNYSASPFSASVKNSFQVDITQNLKGAISSPLEESQSGATDPASNPVNERYFIFNRGTGGSAGHIFSDSLGSVFTGDANAVSGGTATTTVLKDYKNVTITQPIASPPAGGGSQSGRIQYIDVFEKSAEEIASATAAAINLDPDMSTIFTAVANGADVDIQSDNDQIDGGGNNVWGIIDRTNQGGYSAPPFFTKLVTQSSVQAFTGGSDAVAEGIKVSYSTNPLNGETVVFSSNNVTKTYEFTSDSSFSNGDLISPSNNIAVIISTNGDNTWTNFLTAVESTNGHGSAAVNVSTASMSNNTNIGHITLRNVNGHQVSFSYNPGTLGTVGTPSTPGQFTPGTPSTPGQFTPGTPSTPGQFTPGTHATVTSHERIELSETTPRSSADHAMINAREELFSNTGANLTGITNINGTTTNNGVLKLASNAEPDDIDDEPTFSIHAVTDQQRTDINTYFTSQSLSSPSLWGGFKLQNTVQTPIVVEFEHISPSSTNATAGDNPHSFGISNKPESIFAGGGGQTGEINHLWAQWSTDGTNWNTGLEIYNPLTNLWTKTGFAVNSDLDVSDGTDIHIRFLSNAQNNADHWGVRNLVVSKANADKSDNDLATETRTAVSGNSSLGITPSGSNAEVTLTQDTAGVEGETTIPHPGSGLQPIVSSVAPTAFSGGTGTPTTINTTRNELLSSIPTDSDNTKHIDIRRELVNLDFQASTSVPAEISNLGNATRCRIISHATNGQNILALDKNRVARSGSHGIPDLPSYSLLATDEQNDLMVNFSGNTLISGAQLDNGGAGFMGPLIVKFDFAHNGGSLLDGASAFGTNGSDHPETFLDNRGTGSQQKFGGHSAHHDGFFVQWSTDGTSWTTGIELAPKEEYSDSWSTGGFKIDSTDSTIQIRFIAISNQPAQGKEVWAINNLLISEASHLKTGKQVATSTSSVVNSFYENHNDSITSAQSADPSGSKITMTQKGSGPIGNINISELGAGIVPLVQETTAEMTFSGGSKTLVAPTARSGVSEAFVSVRDNAGSLDVAANMIEKTKTAVNSLEPRYTFSDTSPRLTITQTDVGVAGNDSPGPGNLAANGAIGTPGSFARIFQSGVSGHFTFTGGVDPTEESVTFFYEVSKQNVTGSGYAPYTPPFLDPDAEPYIEFSITPTEGKRYAWEDVVQEIETSYVNFKATPSNSQDSENTNENFKYAMNLEASLDWYSSYVVPITSFEYSEVNSDTIVQIRKPEEEKYKRRWVIQTKWETPIIDFTESLVSASYLENGVQHATSTYGSPWEPERWNNYLTSTINMEDKEYLSGSRGIWHQYGVEPIDQKGYYLEIADVDEPDVGSLATIVGFKSGDVSFKNEKIGKISETREISEAVVAIPYYTDSNDNIKFFNLDKSKIFNAVEENKKIQKELLAPPTPSERDKTKEEVKEMRLIRYNNLYSQPSNPVAYQMRMMERYIFPPQFDFITFPEKIDNEEAVAMYVFEFKAKLNKQDLINIWQNVKPTSAQSCVVPQHSSVIGERPDNILDTEYISHELGSRAESLLDNSFLREKVRWVVFKVKRRAESDYSKIKINSAFETLESENFIPQNWKEKLSTFRRDRELKDISYSYNWPYDFFSLVELVKIESKVDFKLRDTGIS